jgi:hypothetical protein
VDATEELMGEELGTRKEDRERERSEGGVGKEGGEEQKRDGRRL